MYFGWLALVDFEAAKPVDSPRPAVIESLLQARALLLKFRTTSNDRSPQSLLISDDPISFQSFVGALLSPKDCMTTHAPIHGQYSDCLPKQATIVLDNSNTAISH